MTPFPVHLHRRRSVVANVGCSCSPQIAFLTQESGHARERLSPIGPLGLARYLDSVVAGMSEPMAIRVEDAEGQGSAWDHLWRPVSAVHDGQGEADAGPH